MLRCTRRVPAVTGARRGALSRFGQTVNRSTTGSATSRTTTGVRIATARGERRRASPAYQELPSPEGDLWAPEGLVSREPPADPADRPRATDAHRAAIERRRLVAGIVVVVVLALGVAIAVLLAPGRRSGVGCTGIRPYQHDAGAGRGSTVGDRDTPSTSTTPRRPRHRRAAPRRTRSPRASSSSAGKGIPRSSRSSRRPCRRPATTPVRPTGTSVGVRRRLSPHSRKRMGSPSTVGSDPRPRQR